MYLFLLHNPRLALIRGTCLMPVWVRTTSGWIAVFWMLAVSKSWRRITESSFTDLVFPHCTHQDCKNQSQNYKGLISRARHYFLLAGYLLCKISCPQSAPWSSITFWMCRSSKCFALILMHSNVASVALSASHFAFGILCSTRFVPIDMAFPSRIHQQFPCFSSLLVCHHGWESSGLSLILLSVSDSHDLVLSISPQYEDIVSFVLKLRMPVSVLQQTQVVRHRTAPDLDYWQETCPLHADSLAWQPL